MVLLEEFKDKALPDIRSHLDEQKVEELEKAAIMADDYALTHKMSRKSGYPQQKRCHGSGNRENISRNMDDRKRQENIVVKCGKFNHKSEDCRIAKIKLQKEVKPTGVKIESKSFQ